MIEEEDDTVYVRMTEDEHRRVHDSLAEAMQALEWVAEEIGAVMHKGKGATAALLAIKTIVDEHEDGLRVVVHRNAIGDVVATHVVRP